MSINGIQSNSPDGQYIRALEAKIRAMEERIRRLEGAKGNQKGRDRK